MEPADWLELLKYAGFLLTAAAAIWGLTQKTTFEDSEGHKRLTPAGYAAMALALGSSLVAASAFGFETVIRDEAAKKAQQVKLDQERLQYVELLARYLDRAEAAEVRVRLANQRSLSLAIAAADRTRQLMIAGELGRRAAVNLSKAELALGEIRRVLQQAGLPTLKMELGVEGPIAMSETLRSKFDQLAAQYGLNRPDSSSNLFINSNDQLYPSSIEDMALHTLIGSGVRAVFYSGANARPVLDRLRNGRVVDSAYGYNGDYSFHMREQPRHFVISATYDKLAFWLEEAPDEVLITKTGDITAVQDFEQAFLVIFQRDELLTNRDQQRSFREMRDRSHLTTLTIYIAGRTYTFRGDDLEKIRMLDGQMAWIVGPVKSGRQ